MHLAIVPRPEEPPELEIPTQLYDQVGSFYGVSSSTRVHSITGHNIVLTI
jgi:hypothetical protein